MATPNYTELELVNEVVRIIEAGEELNAFKFAKRFSISYPRGLEIIGKARAKIAKKNPIDIDAEVMAERQRLDDISIIVADLAEHGENQDIQLKAINMLLKASERVIELRGLAGHEIASEAAADLSPSGIARKVREIFQSNVGAGTTPKG